MRRCIDREKNKKSREKNIIDNVRNNLILTWENLKKKKMEY